MTLSGGGLGRFDNERKRDFFRTFPFPIYGSAVVFYCAPQDFFSHGRLHYFGVKMLTTWINDYLDERDVTASHADNYRRTVRQYADHIGREPDEFDFRSINRWLTSMVDRGQSRETVRGHRRALAALWRWCEEQGYCDASDARRLKKIKPVRNTPVAIYYDEIERLVAAAAKLRGVNSDGSGYSCPMSLYFPALIVGACSLGYRRGDMFSVPRKPLLDHKTVYFRESKTQRTYGRRLDDWGHALLAALPSHELAYPWFRNKTTFAKTWRRLRTLSGVQKSFKQLRCTFVSASGWRHEDPSVSRNHYLDPVMAGEKLPTVPAIR